MLSDGWSPLNIPPTLQLWEVILQKAPTHTMTPQNASLQCLAGFLEWEAWQSVEAGVGGEALTSAVEIAIPFLPEALL